MRYHFTPTSLAQSKKPNNTESWWGCRIRAILIHCWQECKFVKPLMRVILYYLVNLNMPMTFNILHKKAHIRLFTLCNSKIVETTPKDRSLTVSETDTNAFASANKAAHDTESITLMERLARGAFGRVHWRKAHVHRLRFSTNTSSPLENIPIKDQAPSPRGKCLHKNHPAT